VRRPPSEVLGVSYKVISLRPEKLFGILKDWIDGMPFMVTDREKTIIDGLDLPQYVGGVTEIAKALSTVWTQLDESKLRKYAVKIGNSAVAKRLGFLMERLGLGNVEALRNVVTLAPGFSPLEPKLPRQGKYNRRWGPLVNMSL
jgi:predicted transcriptional regulator of viral defense system